MVTGKHHSLNPKDACNASGLYIYERIGNDSLQGSSPLNGGNREISPFTLFTNTSYEVTIYRKTWCKCRKRRYIDLQGFAPQSSLSPNGGNREIPSFTLFKNSPLECIYFNSLPSLSVYYAVRQATSFERWWYQGISSSFTPLFLLMTSHRCYYIVLTWGAVVPPPFEAALLLLFFIQNMEILPAGRVYCKQISVV